MFVVTIKEETFKTAGMEFLHKKGFKAGKEYKVVGLFSQKLLIADTDSGEMVELFPRNCIYIRKDS